ncbi:MAG: GNAT family N-acetyltransferase [Rhizobium sp.]|uniref:N-acetyltransferase family protein n=1 Tax=Rhizobium sp. TaxID=391 RepID=UPI000AF31091
MIRTATERGTARIVKIRAKTFYPILPRSHLKDLRWFIPNPGVFVWNEDGDMCGFSAADTRNGFIWALFVDERYGNHGIAGALLERACTTLRSAGFWRIWLTTDAGTRAENVSRRAGWRLTDHRDGELLFELKL